MPKPPIVDAEVPFGFAVIALLMVVAVAASAFGMCVAVYAPEALGQCPQEGAPE